MNITEVPRVFAEIYAGAFGFQSVAGGAIGTIILVGVQRGMFSNVAGLGSAPNAGASAADRGVDLTQQAVVSSLGDWAGILLAVVIFLFAFSSILGNYYYGESNLEFITENSVALTIYRLLVVLAVLGGSVASADLIWDTADGMMGIMALVNLVAIALLGGVAFTLLKNYQEQRAAGKEPVFTRDQLPDVRGIELWVDEDSVTGPIPLVRRKKGERAGR